VCELDVELGLVGVWQNVPSTSVMSADDQKTEFQSKATEFLSKATESQSKGTELESKAMTIVLSDDDETDDDDFDSRAATSFNHTNSHNCQHTVNLLGDKTASVAQPSPVNAGNDNSNNYLFIYLFDTQTLHALLQKVTTRHKHYQLLSIGIHRRKAFDSADK